MNEQTPEALLDLVCDRDSFIAFVDALSIERDQASDLEKKHPSKYVVDGALNWKNGDIASFLAAGLDYFEEEPFHKPELSPSWRMFAEFLYCGKIIE